jgi:hypothetical protein
MEYKLGTISCLVKLDSIIPYFKGYLCVVFVLIFILNSINLKCVILLR